MIFDSSQQSTSGILSIKITGSGSKKGTKRLLLGLVLLITITRKVDLRARFELDVRTLILILLERCARERGSETFFYCAYLPTQWQSWSKQL